MEFEAPIKYTAQNPLFKELIADKMSRQYFMHHNGMTLSKIEAGYIEAQAPLNKNLLQQDGFVHGGVTSSIADIVTGFAAFSLVKNDDRVVTSDLKVSYFNPGKGDTIFARGWVIKAGSRLHYCESEIYVIKDEIYFMIAKGYSIMAVISGKNKSGSGAQ